MSLILNYSPALKQEVGQETSNPKRFYDDLICLCSFADSQPVVHVIASRSQDWSEHEIAVDTSPTIIYQDVSSESQSATSTIKALLELQQTTGVKTHAVV